MVPTAVFDPVRVTDIEKESGAIWAEYKASLEAGDVDRWLRLWTDDCVQMPDGAPARVGKSELGAATLVSVRAFVIEFGEAHIDELRVAGDWAFTRGSYTARFTPRSGGEAVPVNGKFLTIFAREPDGVWKIHRDIFNSNPA